ncbi:restriction endonuclease [Bacillus sp. EB600]|uniref:restriction endonuclease n=1 Tax=Bacillus sp. EB600 TaxID=2806345 RepID=UPI0021097CF7|nr:restriction endonuclease [Bacillus sp. EB600]MCQ6282638.1 restriction endonuclease [Bacillus sp. EB600]
MAKKRRNKDSDGIGILFIFGLILFFSLLKFAPLFLEFIVLLIPIGIIYLIYKRYKRYQILKKSDFYTIDDMEGIEFENYLKVLFQSLGYNASVTKTSGDFGADLILWKNSTKILVQAKRYSKKVGVSAVQQIVAAKNMYNADEICVATNNYFTKPAKQLAQANDVNLIDRDQIVQLIYRANKESSHDPSREVKKKKASSLIVIGFILVIVAITNHSLASVKIPVPQKVPTLISAASKPSTTSTDRVAPSSSATSVSPATENQADINQDIAFVTNRAGEGYIVDPYPDALVPDGYGGMLYAFIVKNEGDGATNQIYFFINNRFVGTDTPIMHGPTTVAPGSTGIIIATYAHYLPNDPMSTPSGTPYTCSFHWNGSQLVSINPQALYDITHNS